MWLYTSYALSLSEEKGDCVGLCLPDRSWRLACEISEALHTHGSISRAESGSPLRIADTRARRLKPTRIRHVGDFGHICYRFDAHYDPKNKSAPEQHESAFCAAMTAQGFKAIRLGRNAEIRETIDLVSKARFCVTVNTGISQLIYSVGCPNYIVQYGASDHQVSEWDSMAVKVCANIPEFLKSMSAR